MEESNKKQGVRAIWNLNRNCNFDCSYCFVGLKNGKPGRGMEVDVPALKNSGIPFCEINMSGGEPFIYPSFVDLCIELCKFTNISVTTNCSTSNVYDFADRVNPDNVEFLMVSLHIGQRPGGYDSLIDKILYLRKKGFCVLVTQVIHPSLFEEYQKVYKYFESRDVLVVPKPMKGVWRLREYPCGYSEQQKRTILKYAEWSKSQHNAYREMALNPMIYGHMDWKGQPCGAGCSSVIIRYNGDVCRCYGDPVLLGNIYRGKVKLFYTVRSCPSDFCSCEIEGRYHHAVDGFVHTRQDNVYVARQCVGSLMRRSNFLKQFLGDDGK